jgi:putative Ca2+/H+ antiporter (TMEM165/GDT1 family)
MSITALVQAFVTVFPAELPDKTMVATIVLVARFRRPLWVWVGAVSAFAVHVVVAVAAGSALALLPDVVVSIVVALLFATGSVVLLRSARRAPDEDVDDVDQVPTASTWTAVAGSFGVIVLAEWGDITQLATASLAASSGAPIATGLGAWLALASVAAIAAAFGRQLIARVPVRKVLYVGAAVFAALAVWTLVDLVR